IGEPSVQLQEPESASFIQAGSDVILRCHLDASGEVHFEWFRRIIHPNGTLEIRNVTESDQGLYSCVGIRSESAEVPQSYTAELKLACYFSRDLEPLTSTSFEPPLPDDSKQIVGEGFLFQLTCLEPKKLSSGKKMISDSGDVRVDDGRLIIENITLEHAVTLQKTCDLNYLNICLFLAKPEITFHPSSVTVDENETSLLTCGFQSDSLPYTLVKWRKDGKLIKHDYGDSTLNHQRIRVYKQNGTLVIHNTVTTDRGEYVCEVVTTGQKPVLSKPATISVIEKLKFAPPSRKQEDGIGKRCQNSFHVTDMNGTLHFNSVQAEDKGKYICFASNSQGNINASIIIDVVATKTENGDVEHTELKDGANSSSAGPSKTKVNGIENHKEGQKSDGAETTNSQSSNHSKKSKSSNYDKLALSKSPKGDQANRTGRGDLKKFLLATQTDSTPSLTSVQCVAILHQLSRGMDHLANSRMVHKDLAARNCLVSSTLVAKVSLPRLTRDPYSQEYCKHVNQIIPLRWLPYEAVYEDEYSTKSDMYSFGVLIWEIFAQGELPQSKINDTSFLSKLKEKQLEWKVHPSTPEALIKIQESCWDVDPKKRPSFSEVSKEIGEVLKSM
ncbi:hypothetical protein NQ318_023450, partial [Aromia moschata]